MPNQISYPYRPPLLLLFGRVVALGVSVLIPSVLPAGLWGNLPAFAWIFTLTFGLLAVFSAYAVTTTAISTYFCWIRKTEILLRLSDLIVPLGLTQRGTTIRYADIGYVEKTYANKSLVLNIMLRNGPMITIQQGWLPTIGIDTLQAELATRRQISEHGFHG